MRNNALQTILLSTLTFSASGCGGPVKIDGSSEKAYNDSIMSAKTKMSPEEKAEFEGALQAVVTHDPSTLYEFAADPGRAKRLLFDRVHGKT